MIAFAAGDATASPMELGELLNALSTALPAFCADVHPEVAEQAEWLWELMHAIDDDMRGKLFRFVTGSSRRPASGFIDFRIGPKAGGDGAYPFAHACANSLDMPSYSSPAVLRERLEAAVDAAHDKFTDL